MTCWRRLDEWQQAGVWDELHALLLARLRAAGEIEWSRAVIESSQVQAGREKRDALTLRRPWRCRSEGDGQVLVASQYLRRLSLVL